MILVFWGCLLTGSGYLGYVDSNQGYNLYKWVICPLTRVKNLHITSYNPYPEPLSMFASCQPSQKNIPWWDLGLGLTPEATPLQQLLIERSGFLLGLEAPKPLDPEKSKVPEVWRVEDGCEKNTR